MSSSRSISRDIRKILYGSATVIAGLGIAPPAFSQDKAVIEEVVVTGFKRSLEESLEVKRDAVGVVDALTAEDVGKFPDKNVAEALQRIPGIVINREFGEGERVNVRGTSTNMTKTMLNGHTLATADWFILEQLATTRAFNYLMLPSEIIGQVVAYKSQTADLEEGGIGATIDVRTRNPLDLDPMVINATILGAYTELSDDFDPQASALFSWKNSSETMGFLIAGIYQERNIRRDGVEVLGYSPFDTDPSPTATNDVLFPSLIGSALFQQERKRTGGNFGFQFRPSDSLEFNLTGLYSKFEGDNNNANFLAWGSNALGGGGTLTNVTMQQDTAIAGTITSANGGTTGRAVVYDFIDRFAEAKTSSIDLDVTFRPTDAWTLHFKGGYTEADGDTNNQILAEFGQSGSFNYDLRGESPQVTFTTLDPTVPADMNFDFGNLNQVLNKDDESYFYLDALTAVDAGVLKSVKFGAKYTDHTRDLVFNATTYGTFFVPLNTTGCGGPCSSSYFADGLTPGDFLDKIAASGTLRSYWQVDKQVTEDTFFPILEAGPGRIPYPPQNFSVKEEAYAAYVMGNFEGERWRANLGLRYVDTDQKSEGNVIGGPNPQIPSPFGAYTPVSVDRSYTNWLPSLNFAYDVSDDVVVRLAAGQAMTRADFVDIAPRVSLNPGALTAVAGNPDLDPYLSNQGDLSMEWYPAPGAALSVAVYYKDLKSYITEGVSTQFLPVSTANPITACVPIDPANQLFDCPFTVLQRVNSKGTISGYEIAVTAPLGHGFGVLTNYTYADAESENGLPVPGASQDQFNITGWFENEIFSARLSYSYRSEFMVNFDRTTRLFEGNLESLDLSLVWDVTKNIALTFDAVNLTNDKIKQFADEEFRPRAHYDNGPYYYIGARFLY